MPRVAWLLQLMGSVAASSCLVVLLCAGVATATKVCDASKFGPYIEGAAVSNNGNVFAVNGDYQRNVISYASGSCDKFAQVNDKPDTSLNSIRVLPDGRMLSSDSKNARIVMISADGKRSSTYCEGAGMIAPNDLAITSKGYVYISGQRWTDNTIVGDGGVWLCKGPGEGMQLALLGRTNGIEVSPDDKYLYVSEAFNKAGTPVSNKILRYTLNPDGTLGTKTVFYDFAVNNASSVDIDGMRTDLAGNLYVTRNQVNPGSTTAPGGAQQVVVISPSGVLLKKIPVPFSSPTNLELAGSDGKTLYVVGRCGIDEPFGMGSGCVEEIDLGGSAAPGRAWSMLQKGLPKVALLQRKAAGKKP